MKITIDKTIIDPTGKRFSEVSKEFNNFINDMIIIYNVDHIITNGMLGSCLQNSLLFDFSPLSSGVTQLQYVPYYIGNFNGRKILIDPFMRWDDHRMIMKYDRSVILSHKINKLLKKIDYVELLEEINIIDEDIKKQLI